jgi:hypothetical protein
MGLAFSSTCDVVSREFLGWGQHFYKWLSVACHAQGQTRLAHPLKNLAAFRPKDGNGYFHLWSYYRQPGVFV